MNREFIIVKCDVYCEWEDVPPRYRVFVNDELFGERTYVWQEQYLEEMLQIFAAPGNYVIKYELVPPSRGALKIKNMRIVDGPPGSAIVKNELRVAHAST